MLLRRTALAVILFVAVLSSHAPAQQRDLPAFTGTAAISGTVVTTGSNPQPVRLARVVLSMPASGWASVLGVTTDDEGRFALEKLPAGRYTLTAERPAFIGLDYGAERAGRPGTEIALSNGQQMTGVVLKMIRGAAITGRVTDQSGAPLSGVMVRPLRRGFSPTTGLPTLTAGRDDHCSTSDDRGIYRCYGLIPGEYVVMSGVSGAGGRAGQPPATEIRQVLPGDVTRALQQARGLGPVAQATPAKNEPVVWQSGPAVGYTLTYYPGTLDASAAATITVGAGEERSGLDLAMMLVAASRIDGQVVVPDGVPLSAVAVQRNPTGPPRPGVTGETTPLDASGRFSFAGVSPGTWVITARATGANEPVWWADETVTADGRNVQLEMRLKPGLVVSGRIMFDGASPPPDLKLIRVALASRGGINRGGPAATTINVDGTFSMPGVTPDRYSLNLTGTLGPWVTVSSIMKSTEMLDGPVTIDAADRITDWTIRMTDRPAELTGVLQSAAGRPAPDYFIVVFATDRARWSPAPSRRVALLRPASDGRFSTNTLPAGTYYIAALTDVEPGEQWNPAFLEQLIPFATRITLADGQKTTQDLAIKK
jgi:hypothetical protein